MVFAFLKRYWITLVGGAVLAVSVVIGVLSISSDTVASLVEGDLKDKGRSFAEVLTSDGGHLEVFLTGIAREPDAERQIRQIASLSDIKSFTIFDRNGNERFTSHSDRYEWLLRDRPGGHLTGATLSEATLAKKPPFQLVSNDGNADPSVVTPLVRDSRIVGYVSVVADIGENRSRFRSTLTTASVWLLGLLALATGMPALIYLRRRHRMAEADDRIRFLANHDPLTGLYNRAKMQKETDKILVNARATREQMAFCYIDIDGFAEINGSIGQAGGDELLQIVATRLSKAVEPCDLLARIGADDFTLLHRRSGGEQDLVSLAKRLREIVGEPVEIQGQTIRPCLSIGVALVPRHGRAHQDLMKCAELALLHQRIERSGEFCVFESFMDEETHRRREMESRIRDALERQNFELFYQPIVNGDGSALLGFEALIRMPDDAGGYFSPETFISIAESRGYIKSIGSWVIREAARQLAQWPGELFISVNLSAVQFRDGDLVEIVEGALGDAGVPGSRLEIEVVESLILERSDHVLTQLDALRALGISIDMDDFGTGYSSLGYLWRFPFDKLKIDQSFMAAFDRGESKVSDIIATIVSLARLMHMKVTAEGVETQEQVAFLAALGCDQLQGYYFGKPMPAALISAEVLNQFSRRGHSAAHPEKRRPRLAAV